MSWWYYNDCKTTKDRLSSWFIQTNRILHTLHRAFASRIIIIWYNSFKKQNLLLFPFHYNKDKLHISLPSSLLVIYTHFTFIRKVFNFLLYYDFHTALMLFLISWNHSMSFSKNQNCEILYHISDWKHLSLFPLYSPNFFLNIVSH